MKKLYKQILDRLDGEDLVRRTKELNRIDLGQTFKHYHLSCEHILAELKKYGIPNAEIVKVPADGKTVYQDKRMPIAWDASVGKLTLNDKEKTVAADYTVHPFNLIKGSCGVKKGGETMRIITEEQLLAGEDPKNALVMLVTSTWPRAAVLTPILNMGGRGIISDFLTSRYDYPDAVQWVNACTEGNNWHVQCDDRDFVGFSVSLRMGDKIRNLANKGSLSAFVECDGYRYEGELPAVTALVPGKKSEEIWLLAHTFEPLLDDDSNGVTASIEIARQVMRHGTPEYSLRLVFAMELYGYAAFHANFKGKVIGGCNLDSVPASKNQICRLIPPIGPGTFHGVDILKKIGENLEDCFSFRKQTPECFDDMFLSDSTTGVPTIWMLKEDEPGKGLWHTSVQTADDYLDAETFAKHTALAAVWTIETLFYQGEGAEVEKLDVKLIDSPWRRYAAQQIFARNSIGYPQDFVNVPKDKRRGFSIIYNHMGSMFARMDGVKNMAEIIAEAEAERQKTLTDKEIKKFLSACDYFAEYGYLKAVKRTPLTSEMICKALAELGVEKNDVLLVHASISNCGYIEGGAETIIDSIRKVTGDDGAVLFTAFTRPYVYLGGVNKMWLYAPYDEKDLSQIWTGTIAKVLLEKYPDAIRSKHITHSWAGIGNKAAACLKAHGATDAPCGKTSPLAKALELNGKILFFGSGIAPSTFIHYLETEVDANFLETAVCTIKNADGSIEHVTVPQHLPGHRDFYRSDAENCKFFKKAVENGLEIREVELGMGKLNLIDLKQFYEIGLAIMQEDSDIILCDSDDCLFCKKYRKNK